MNRLDHLPTEILPLIAEQLQPTDLYQCVLVNKHFYTALHPLLWRTLVVGNDEDLEKVITCMFDARAPLGQHVRYLESYCDGFNDTVFLLLMNQLPHLESYYSEHANSITDTSIQRLARRYPNLTHLGLMFSPLTPRAIVSLGQHCHQLRKLFLETCPNLSSSGVDFFAALGSCRSLEQLDMDLGDMFDLEDATMADKAVLDLTALDRLTSLVFGNAPNALTESIIDMTAWPRLKTIYISEAYANVTDQHLISFIQSHPHLTSIKLNSHLFTNAALDAIAIFLPKISTVELCSKQFTRLAVDQLVRDCPQLTTIKCAGLVATDGTLA